MRPAFTVSVEDRTEVPDEIRETMNDQVLKLAEYNRSSEQK